MPSAWDLVTPVFPDPGTERGARQLLNTYLSNEQKKLTPHFFFEISSLQNLEQFLYLSYFFFYKTQDS